MNDELIEEKFKVANHRIQDLEKASEKQAIKIEELSDFKYTINSLSETVKELKLTVNNLNNKDGETYKTYKQTIMVAIISSIVGLLAGNILSKLLI